MDKHFGLQTFVGLEKGRFKHINDVAVTVVHWSLAREGLLCVGIGESMTNASTVRSEVLPDGWNSENGAVYSLLYQDGQARGYLLKAVSVDNVLVVSLLDMTSEKSSDLSLTPVDNIECFDEEVKFKEIDELVKKINNELLQEMFKKKQNDGAKDKNKEEASNSQQQKFNQREDDPLAVGGRNPRGINPGMPDYGGMYPSVGGADLDPLRSGMMGGGMLMDPRAGRGRDMQPRWDPVGPGAGGRGRGPAFPRGRGLGGPGRDFGDEMRPPGFNNPDDEDDDYNNMFM